MDGTDAPDDFRKNAATTAAPKHKPYEIFLLFNGFNAQDIQELRQFIDKTGELGQQIDANFSSYLNGNAHTRGVRAEFDLAQTDRMGWVEREAKESGNILKHSRSLARFIAAYDDDRLPQDRSHLIALAEVHDKAEAITTDLTPKQKKDYGFSGAFKSKLEAMAIAILYESTSLSKERALIQEYEDRQTDASKLVSSFDKCYAVMEAMYIESQEPEAQAGFGDVILQETIDAGIVKTDVGRDLLEKLADPAQRDTVMAQFIASQQAPSRSR